DIPGADQPVFRRAIDLLGEDLGDVGARHAADLRRRRRAAALHGARHLVRRSERVTAMARTKAEERALKLYGTLEPVPQRRPLKAGPVSATLENGQLRWIKLGEVEVIRAVAFLVRDRNWSTCNPEIANLRIAEEGGGFAVTFDALCRTPDGELPWRADFRGRP